MPDVAKFTLMYFSVPLLRAHCQTKIRNAQIGILKKQKSSFTRLYESPAAMRVTIQEIAETKEQKLTWKN